MADSKKNWDFQGQDSLQNPDDLNIMKTVLEDEDLFSIPDDAIKNDEITDIEIEIPDQESNKPAKPNPSETKSEQPATKVSQPKTKTKEPKKSRNKVASTGKTQPKKQTTASKPQETEKTDQTKSVDKSETGSAIPEDPEMAPARDSYPILVIDDDKWIQKIFKQYLESWGFEYIGAMNSIDGLRFAMEKDPVLIFLDIVLPDIYGDITLKFIKGYEESKTSPVIIISGSLNKNVLRQTYQDGAIGFITKPFSMEILQNKVLNSIDPKIIARMKHDDKITT